jgi:AcrR family transcriptional regulator
VTPRRQQILDIAADLFAARGFHGVSVAELGSACGISGPALYKHFESKDAMLAEMLVSISETLLTEGRSRVAQAGGPREALEALVEWHIEFAIEHRSLIVVQDRDWSSLPDEARERVRALQRAYVDVWATQLRRHDPALSPETSRTRAHVLFGLLNSTPHSGRLPDQQMHDVLRDMAHGALGLA